MMRVVKDTDAPGVLHPEMMRASRLRGLERTELEVLFAHDEPIDVPRGVYRGEVLARLDNAEARKLHWRCVDKVGFEWLPFGVDFERRLWFFGPRWCAAGRFQPRVTRSRWRSTEAVALDYEASRLPRPIKGLLYDEVKPLAEGLLLGIGGINAPAGRGEHFFFLLELVRD